jgi:secreted Zn-dependent insulinase-like peptidase
MERFADFFVNPLLDAGRISKELKVVDSEFNERKQDDDERSGPYGKGYPRTP